MYTNHAQIMCRLSYCLEAGYTMYALFQMGIDAEGNSSGLKGNYKSRYGFRVRCQHAIQGR